MLKRKRQHGLLSFVERVITRALNISRHEWGRVALAFSVKLLFYMSFVAGTTVLTALFVQHRSIEDLPLLFIVESTLMILGSLAFSGMLHRYKIRKLMIFGSLAAAALLLVSPFTHAHQLLLFFLLATALFVFLFQVQIWIGLFIEDLFTPLESERTFPIIETSKPIGGVLGGIFIVSSIQFFHTEELLFGIGFFLILAPAIIFLSHSFFQKMPRLSFRREEGEIQRESKKEVFLRTVSFFRHSPFFGGLFLIIFLQFFAAYFLEFQYTKAVDLHFVDHGGGHGDSEHADILTHSLGTLHIAIYGVLFFAQILLASNFLRRFGVIKTFALAPLFSFFSFVAMLLTFHIPAFQFPSAVGAKGTFSVTNGVSKNAFAAVFYAMQGHIRDEAKEFLEGVARPLGSILGTLILLALQFFIVDDFYLSTTISTILVVIALVSLFIALRLQKHYTLLSRKSLESRRNLDEKMNAIEILSQPGHEHATDFLVRTLSYGHEIPEVKVKVLKVIGKLQDTSAIPAILKCFHDKDKKVRVAAVESLSEFKNLGDHFFSQAFSQYCVQNALKDILKKSRDKDLKIAAIKVFANIKDMSIIPFLIDVLQKEKDPKLQGESISICGLFHDASSISYLEPFLMHEDPHVRASAITALWQFVPLRLQLVLQMADMLESKDVDTLLAGIHAVGETRSSQEKSHLKKLLNHENDEVRRHAAIALAKMNEEEAVEHILEFLFHDEKHIGKHTKELSQYVHEDILRTIQKQSAQYVAHRVMSIMEEQEKEFLEDLEKEFLMEILHLFELINAEREIWKIRMILEEK